MRTNSTVSRLLVTTVCLLALCWASLLPAVAGAASLTKTVTYLPGATDTTGSVPVDPNNYGLLDPITVLDPGTLARPGYTFAGWKLAAQGSEVTVKVFPTVNQAPAEVVALGQDAVDEFLFEYAPWVELCILDESATAAPYYQVFSRVRVMPGGEDLIGTATFPYVPAGNYLMAIWRPGFVLRVQMVTADGVSGQLTETYAPSAFTVVFDGSLSVLTGGEAVIDIEDAYCLLAGDVDANKRVNTTDGSIIREAYGKDWLSSLTSTLLTPRDFAAIDITGDGVIDTDDIDLAYRNDGLNYSEYAGTGPLMEYLDGLGIVHTTMFTSMGNDLYQKTSYNPYADIEILLNTLFQPGNTITLPGNIVLVAQWTANEEPPKPPGPGGNGEKPTPELPPTGDESSPALALVSGCVGAGLIMSLAPRKRLFQR